VQPPFRCLLVAKAPCLVDLGVGVDVQPVVVEAVHALLLLAVDDGVDVISAQPHHERHVAVRNHLQARNSS